MQPAADFSTVTFSVSGEYFSIHSAIPLPSSVAPTQPVYTLSVNGSTLGSYQDTLGDKK